MEATFWGVSMYVSFVYLSTTNYILASRTDSHNIRGSTATHNQRSHDANYIWTTMHTQLFHTIGGRLTPYKPFTGTQYIHNFKDLCYNILRLGSEKSKELNNEDGLFFSCHQLLKEKYDFET